MYQKHELLGTNKDGSARRVTHVRSVSHTGAPDPEFYAAPGEAGLTSHPDSIPKASGMKEVTGVHADLGKSPKVKRAYTDPVPMHSGSNAKSRRTGEHFHGLSGQDISRYDANGPDPLAGAPRGKDLKPVAITPGMKSRTSPALTNDVHFALGKAVLAGAKMSPDDKMAYGIGALPPATSEN